MAIGKALDQGTLTRDDIEAVVREGADALQPDGKRIVVLIPDLTRSGPTDVMTQIVADAIAPRAKQLDFMVALGTHHGLDDEQMKQLTGRSQAEWTAVHPNVRLLNHEWDNPDALKQIGSFPPDLMSEYTDGMLSEEIPITVNRRAIEDYDVMLICGPVFPHEVVGMSGGNKYIFPGISGSEFLQFFHWVGALITIPRVIGNKDTRVREVLNYAARLIPVERQAFCYAVEGRELAALHYGTPEDAWSAAADTSQQRHITYIDKPFNRVLARAPEMYDDLWVGGKCMYKMESVLADGAELIIYAPHITEISYTHGKLLREIGYHTRDFFVENWEDYRDYPWGLLAHSSHVRGIGRMENGVEKCRVQVTLATGIPEDVCREINMGYMDPATVDVAEFQGREDEGIVYVPKAGEILYRLKNPPEWAR
jgi:nickel-dependent lactate racemase